MIEPLVFTSFLGYDKLPESILEYQEGFIFLKEVFSRFLNRHKGWELTISLHYSCPMAPSDEPMIQSVHTHTGFFLHPPMFYFIDMVVVTGLDETAMKEWYENHH